jgi:CheY-like chemotaxis protein
MKKHRYILLAEDDPDDRELFMEAVAIVDPAIRVSTVENGEKLMDHLRQHEASPDCIFLDLNMPRKGGKECLQEIRNNEKTHNIPVIVYSTSLNARDVDDTFRFGASRFIRKPGTFRELTDLLNSNLIYFFIPSTHTRRNFVINPQKAYGK